MMRSTLAREGNLYKGNLHTHTTLSDGRKTPAETVGLYKEQGYHFLALTDHEVYGIHRELSSNNFLVLPGVELEIDARQDPNYWQVHHLLAIGGPYNNYPHGYQFYREENQKVSLQALIATLHRAGNLVIYNHPHWSRVELSQFVNLVGLNGMEIFNYGCHVEDRSGNGESFYDGMLWHGKKVWCYGTDDSHMRIPDMGGGYITVKAPALTLPEVFRALQQGSFYASAAVPGKEAPRIHDFYWEDGIVKLFCDPCRRVYIKGDCHQESKEDLSGGVTYLETQVPVNSRWVRAACEDANGFVSWTQPIWLD